MGRMPPHLNTPPAAPSPSTTLQSIPANLCHLTVPRSILDFRSFQDQTLAVLIVPSQSCPCPCACTEPQHVLPNGTQPLPQHVPHPHGAAMSGIMGAHHPRESERQTVWGQVMLLLLSQDIAWLCSASLAPPGLGKQQSLVPGHPLAGMPACATQPGCCLFKTFIPKSE